MKNLRDYVDEASRNGIAIGHFNISNIEGFWAVIKAAKTVNVPVIIGVSEGERDFIGVEQVKALVQSVRKTGMPVFLNADHTYSVSRVKEVIDAGFDSVIFDGAELDFEENIKLSKESVDYAHLQNPDVLVEGELGYIGQSSKLLDELPSDVELSSENLTTPEEAEDYVKRTGVDLLAPAVGNIHGMLKSGINNSLDMDRIKEIRKSTGVPLVLHGGSGVSDSDFRDAIKSGISIVHINTEIRVAYRDAVKRFLQENPDETTPYKIMKEAVIAMEKVIEKRMILFSGK